MSAKRRRERAPRPPAQGRPIRVVPLHVPGVASAPIAAPAAAKLTWRGGPVIGAVQVVTAFWGAPWGAAEQATASSLNDFFRFVVASAYMDQLGEYSTSQQRIGHGASRGTATITDGPAGSSVTDAAIQQMLDQQVGGGGKVIPPPTPDTLYFVFLPPGVAVVAGTDQSCQTFCGYHDRSSSGLLYAVVPWPDCAGCLGGLAPLDALTSVSSHELAEAVTDPVPGQGWYDDANGEIGDICAWQNKQLGAYTVQTLWSNRANACL